MKNYNLDNIDAVKRSIDRERIGQQHSKKKAFTMIQRNSSNSVTVSERSRKDCARILMG